MDFKLKTHHTGQACTGHHFFILNKGLNAGKPLLEPCPNCWVITLNTEMDLQQIYTLQTAVWNSGACRFYLIGSVIFFIRIGAMEDLLQKAINQVNFADLEETSCTLKQVLEIETIFQVQLRSAQKIRRVLYSRLLKDLELT